jgi:FkbM family methyltransferase
VSFLQIQVGDVLLNVDGDDSQYSGIIPEVVNVYRFGEIEFRKRDKVIDVGAHLGLVSMYLAKLHPEIRIYSYEPVPELYERFCNNLEANGITNVVPHQAAVTADGRWLEMIHGNHSAEATAYGIRSGRYVGEPFTVRSTTIPRILRRYKIKRVRLLKLDCEGAEHEILAKSRSWMSRVDHVRGEIHTTPELREMGYDVEETKARVPQRKCDYWQVVGV